MTASTGVVSATSQSQTPYNDMDFSLAKISNVTLPKNRNNVEEINPVEMKITADVTESRHEKKPSQTRGDTKSPLLDVVNCDAVSEDGDTAEMSTSMIDPREEIPKVKNQPDDDVIEKINSATVPNHTPEKVQISFEVVKPGSEHAEIRPTHASDKMSKVMKNTLEANAITNQARALEKSLEKSKRGSDIRSPQDHHDAREYQSNDTKTNESIGIAPKAKIIWPPSCSLVEVNVGVSANENQDYTLDPNEEMESDDDVMVPATDCEDENSPKEAMFKFDMDS